MKQKSGLRKIIGLSGAGSKASVLDVACGPGFTSYAFAKSCERVVGVDITDAFLEQARDGAMERGLRNIEFVKRDVEGLGFEDDSFDVCISRAAFHHFLHPFEVLCEINRVTKPGGKIMVLGMVGSEDVKKASLHNRMEILCDPAHVRALSVSEFERFLGRWALKSATMKKSLTKYSVAQWLDHGGPTEKDEVEGNSGDFEYVFTEGLSRLGGLGEGWGVTLWS